MSSTPAVRRDALGGSLALEARGLGVRARLGAWGNAFFGRTVGARVVGLTAVVSTGLFVVFSEGVRDELSTWAYRRALITQFFEKAAAPSAASLQPLDVRETVLGVVFIATCVLIGVLAARWGEGRGAGAPLGLVAGLAAAVVPPQLMATVLWPDGGGLLSSPILLLATWVAATPLLYAWWRQERHRAGAPHDHAEPPAPNDDARVSAWWGRACLAICLPLAIAVLVNGYADIQGFDAYGYHLPLAGRWWQRAQLITGPEEAMNLFYPGNFELVLRWVMTLGSDRLAYLPSFASSVVALIAIYGISREIGQPRSVAIVSSLSAVSLAVFVFQSTIAYSDGFTAALLLIAVWLLVRWARGGAEDTRLVVGLGLALGLAAGSKYSALPTAIVIVVVWAWLLLRHGHRFERSGRAFYNVRWATGQVVALVVPAVGCSIYWYLRNAIEHGNPVYPVSVMGLRGLPLEALISVPASLASAGWRWLVYPWREPGYSAANEHGLGAAFAAVALLGFVIIPFLRSRPRRPLRSIVWLIGFASYVLWLRTGVVIPRYGMFPLLLTFVFVGELWLAFESNLLKLVTVTCVAATVLVLTRAIVVGTMYMSLVGARRTGVPDVVDRLPPSRIFNAAGQPGGYYALGRDYRHDVVTVYRDALPNDVVRTQSEYLLVPESQAGPFKAALHLTLVGRWVGLGLPATELWKVEK